MQYMSKNLLLLRFQPCLHKGVEILFILKFNDNRSDGFAILALVLLPSHESHVRVDANAHARWTCYEGHDFDLESWFMTSRFETQLYWVGSF